MTRTTLSIIASIYVLMVGCQPLNMNSDQTHWNGWVSLFDGKSLNGWTASEHADTFSVKDGMIVVNGDRSHLFYSGKVMKADFKNFELKLDVMFAEVDLLIERGGEQFHYEIEKDYHDDLGLELEAMKMKNMIHSSVAGVIASVDVIAGQTVDYGAVLATFE